MRLAFTLEYDGTDFSGFQLQKNAITIQEHLEKAIKEITATDIKINYSGRTDAGVHAISQVFDFETEIQRDDNSWIRGINSNLPKSIAVKNIFHVPTDFNSRFSALERRYAYVIYNSTNKPLFFDKWLIIFSALFKFSALNSKYSGCTFEIFFKLIYQFLQIQCQEIHVLQVHKLAYVL